MKSPAPAGLFVFNVEQASRLLERPGQSFYFRFLQLAPCSLRGNGIRADYEKLPQ
jgi:hypothetical protein